MPKLAANLTLMFNEVDFLDRFGAAARAGFKGVEYLFPYDFDKAAIAERLHDNDLEQVLFDFSAGDFPGGDRGIAVQPSRVGEFQDSVGQALEYAAVLNCKLLTCLAGIPETGVSDDRTRQTYVDNLKFAAPQLAERGITLLIEALNSRDAPGFWLLHTSDARSIVEEVGATNLAVQYDIYHMQIMEGDLITTIEANKDLIRHYQLADNPGRNEPGTGEINYPKVLDYIDSTGYAGWIGCEYKPAGKTEDGLGWARRYL